MNFKILKKDLLKRRSMNFILLLFVVLSAMFISSSINNLSAIASGISYFFEVSDMSDFIFITMQDTYNPTDANTAAIEGFLEENRDIIDESIADECVYLAKTNLLLADSTHPETDLNLFFNELPLGQQKFFDEKNNEITGVEQGCIYIPISLAQSNGIRVDDSLTLTVENGFEKEFRVAGFFKDALLGSDMTGITRLLIHEADLADIRDHAELPYGMLYSVRTTELEQFKNAYNKADITTIFGGDQSFFGMTYLLDLVISAVLLLVSLCLILISAGMLRFMVSFTINEDYKEIGIMKAIGMSDHNIRALFVSKYLILAIAGSMIGFFAGIPFGRKLLESATQHIVVKSSGLQSVLLELAVSACVAGIIILFAYRSTKKIKKMSPMDAIRRGNNGERYHKKSMFFLKKSRLAPTTYLACNDVLCSKKKFAALFFTSIVGMWLLIMPVNTINTLSSEKIGKFFSMQECDFYISDAAAQADCIAQKDKQSLYDYTDKIKKELTDAGIPVKNVTLEVLLSCTISKGELSCKLGGMQGIHTKAENYSYDEGCAPMYDNEVALAYGTAEELDAAVGDTVYITINNEEKPFLVTGLYQSMINLGKGLRFHEDTELDYSTISGIVAESVILEEKTDADTLQSYIDTTQKIYKNATVRTPKEYILAMIGGNIAAQLTNLKFLILILVLVINILVVTLMQRMFLIREQGEIGMLKSIGFSNNAIIRWQTKRIAVVLFLGMLTASLTGTPFSRITAGQVFKMMGAKSIEFVVKPLEVYVLYPCIILLITLFACVLSIQKIRKISVQEMNNIE